jgi:hypothetical protein
VATNTPNYNLVKPTEAVDLVDIDVLNSNSDIIDSALHAHDLTLAANAAADDARLDALEAFRTKLELETSVQDTSAGAAISTVELLLMAALPNVTYDGTTEVELMFSSYNLVRTISAETFNVNFYDGAVAGSGTQISRHLLGAISGANGGAITLRTRYTPPAGVHAFSIRAIRNSGTGVLTDGRGVGQPSILSSRPCL